jgi:hypothetical protein
MIPISSKYLIESGYKRGKAFLTEFIYENRDALLCLSIFYLVSKTFLLCSTYGFVNYDDQLYVYNNQHVISGLTTENLLWAFKSTTAANWHPMTMISHMLDCQLYGLRPGGHHITNVVLHAINCALAFLLLRQLTGTIWRSFTAALFFGLHPLRVESVVWISERKDVLSTCFWMLAAIAYAKFAFEIKAENRSGAKRQYVFAMLWFLLALMSKPMVITFPCVLILLDIWPLNRWSWNKQIIMQLLKEKVPFFALVAAFSLITCLAQNEAMYSWERMPLSVRLLNIPVSYCRYLGKCFWPANLALFYPYPLHWPIMDVVACALGLLVLSILVVIFSRRFRFLAVGWFWFLGTLFPVIGLFQAGSQSIADRYSYLPSLGILIAFVWGSFELMRHLKITPFTIGIAVVGIAVLCDSQTVLQITYWSDNEGLWRHAAEVTKNNYVAYGVLGLLEEKRKDYAAAVVDLEKSLKSRGDRNDIRVALGVALRETHRTDEAIGNLYEVVSLQQTNVTARKELALTLIASKRPAEALTNLTFALKIDPENQQLTELMRSLTNAMPLSHTNESATETNHGFAGTGTQGQLFRPAAQTR